MDIVVYGDKDCKICDNVKSTLTKHQLTFVERNVNDLPVYWTNNEVNKQELLDVRTALSLNDEQIPVVFWDNEILMAKGVFDKLGEESNVECKDGICVLRKTN